MRNGVTASLHGCGRRLAGRADGGSELYAVGRSRYDVDGAPGPTGETNMPSAWVRPQQKPDPDAIPFYLGKRGVASLDESGRVLGDRYLLREVLASGGTATVYTAIDRSTGGEVAVKVLYEAARAVVGAFFGQEGRLAARIQSPHLVHARHFGEEDGRLFIVFDLVPGEALPTLYFQELMPWRELCLVVLQVLAGLDALHQGGIVHRDVKPDNIIVKRTLGDEVHVTLLDLGFAWVPPERNLTNAPEPTRQVFGTDGFIAPELLGGGWPEPRNDLYSVGALMYTMLTAQRVPDLSAAPELMEMPSPRAFVPGLPQSVDDIVMRALSDVEARFQDAEEMAAAIRAALDDEVAATRRAADSTPGLPSEPAVLVSRREASSTWMTPDGSSASLSGPSTPSDGGAANIGRGPRTGGHQASRPTWRVPLAMVAGAAMGAVAVWTAGLPQAEVIPASAPMMDEVRADAPSLPEIMVIPDRTPSREFARAVVPVETRPPTTTLAAVQTPRGGSTVATTSPVSVRRRSFAGVMRQVEGSIRACVTEKTGHVPAKPLEVRVRFVPTSGDIDQVRVLDMSAGNPVARCVEDVVRGAAPASGGRPTETFTYFAGQRTAK